MRPDQIQRLRDLTESLADTFLLEADPAEWPGDGMAPANISQEERGNRYWCKKNAMATGGVLRYTLDLLDQSPDTQDGQERVTADMDRKIADAERRASAAVDRVLNKAKKRAFDERPIGKP